ncbi:zinc-binding alcohol dehydrogenase family protein [Limibacter armeniacum]|uniref:zinc-binding alcohol dehydrogenase family protein n=1 Tax=Limibacter armeniacum TaxID=466084 RepID=UPI002FE6739F
MKAIIFKNRKLEDKIDYNTPTLTKPTQILIKIKAAAVNPIDLQMFQGKNEARVLNSNILGRELSGTIEKVGESVKKFKTGDEVYLAVLDMGSNGAFAEYVVVEEEIVALKPSNISFLQAATIPVSYVTAWQVATRLNQPKTSSIFIFGASGSVGKALINLLHHFGYHNIKGTAGNEQSVEQLMKQKLKKENLIHYKSDNLSDEIIKANEGTLYDVVIDCIGNEMTEIGAKVLRREGLYIDITNMKTDNAAYTLFRKAAVIMNISRYSEPELFCKYGEILDSLSKLINVNDWYLQEFMDLGELSSDNLYEAFNLLETNRTKGKKVVLHPSYLLN